MFTINYSNYSRDIVFYQRTYDDEIICELNYVNQSLPVLSETCTNYLTILEQIILCLELYFWF